MKNNKIVLQAIDSPRRDLEWRLYVAYQLSTKGLSSIIGSMREINHILEKSENCIYFGRLPGNTGRTDFDRRTLEIMQKNKTDLFFLHDEGAFYLAGEYESAVRRVYPLSVFENSVCKKVFFWGKKQKDVFSGHSCETKLVTSGAPRFDLGKPKYEFLDQSTIEELKDKYDDFILISGRFSAVNMVPDDPGFLSRRMYEIHVEGGALEHATREEVLTKIFKDWEKTSIEFSRFVAMVAKLALDFPDLNFVFRPHPSERSTTYKVAFSHFNNVFVDKSFDVRTFIRASNALIHCECTTGLEAELAQKPNINYRPCMNLNEFNGIEVAGLSNVGIVVETYEQLKEQLQGLKDTDFKFNQSFEGLSEYLLNSNNSKEATEIIVEEINKLCEIDDSNSIISRGRFFTNISYKDLIVYAKLVMRRYWLKYFLKKKIALGDSKFIYYPDDKIKKMWIEMGGDPKKIKIKNGIIYSYPE
jgi:surface carbohydrate biosynthesis protein